MDTTRYYVSHLTTYRYGGSVALARHMLHLTPRTLPWQMVQAHAIEHDPASAELSAATDNFGNPMHTLTIHTRHRALVVHAHSWIDVDDRPQMPEEDSPPWESVRDQLVFRAGRKPSDSELDAGQFLFESRYVRVKREFAHWAQTCFTPGTPILVGMRRLTELIFETFDFDPESTHIATPVTEVLATKRGVCQDFAHLAISALRSLGLPARYMSGYLLTKPPPGKPRLIGADASHAWLAVWCPDFGWAEYDPTNGIPAGQSHITLGWGRDFGDVTPLRGVIHGGGDHIPEIEVTVVPASEYGKLFGKAVPALLAGTDDPVTPEAAAD